MHRPARQLRRAGGSLADEDRLRLMLHPSTVMTFSDAGAHVGYLVGGSLQTYHLAYWVRQRQKLTLEQAVRMMTSDQARVWGFADRGILAPGYVADLNLLDPDTVGPLQPTVETDLPAGATRIVQRATGVKHTIVGGEVTLEDGQHTGAFGGRLLRAGS